MNSISAQVLFPVPTKRLALVVCLLFSSSFTCYADAPQNQCDIEAANPFDPNKKAPGKEFAAINSGTAVSACEAAVRQYPNEARLQYQMGRSYQAIKRDGEAVVWHQKAADQRYAPAGVSLGGMYADGKGLPVDDVKAAFWYQWAAELGYAVGQGNLGFMYLNGRGLHQDYTKALYWYQKAADQGFASAQFAVGSMYLDGLGVAIDRTKAMEWFSKASSQGDSRGHLFLGQMYEMGWGVSQDNSKAIKLYQKAADAGEQGASEALTSLQKKNTLAGIWTSYSKRSKSTIEEILNYTTNGVEEGTADNFWISGLNGENKCVLSWVQSSKVERSVDIRSLNPQGLRISINQHNEFAVTLIVGDERTKISAYIWNRAQPVMERLQKAWGLAFVECPSEVRRKF